MAGSAAQLRHAVMSNDNILRGKLLQACQRDRGEFWMNEARSYMRRGDVQNALSCVNEGLRSISGPFYLAVRDELEELHSQLLPITTPPQYAKVHPSLLLNARPAL